ncbi:hypothetical protein EXIGLDRAFT_784323, partial [Exidia glandulosa HHB12029]
MATKYRSSLDINLANLKQLAAGLNIQPDGPAHHKKSWQEPLEKYFKDNEATLGHNPVYQHHYFPGASSVPKARAISDDKAVQDSEAAKVPKTPTPAFQGLLDRKMPVDPPGLVLPPKAAKTVSFALDKDKPRDGGSAAPAKAPAKSGQ